MEDYSQSLGVIKSRKQSNTKDEIPRGKGCEFFPAQVWKGQGMTTFVTRDLLDYGHPCHSLGGENGSSGA